MIPRFRQNFKEKPTFRRWLRFVCLQTFVACFLCVSHSPQGTVTQTREVYPFLHLSNRFLCEKKNQNEINDKEKINANAGGGGVAFDFFKLITSYLFCIHIWMT